jgi:cytoplasmic iron level regulating protein YaaA (DUF328/UPF0246 family)
MKIFISPAKSLDLKSDMPNIKHSLPIFTKEASKINSVLKQKSEKSLAELMNLSQKLSMLNWERNQSFEIPFTIKNSRPAIFTFNGDVYSGLDISTLKNDSYELIQKNLRIISGLYGLLRPFDLIQPYRLEMGTSLKIEKCDNLYDFWKSKITNAIDKEINDEEILVNLASKEYASVIDFKLLKNQIISPIFKDFKNGKLKIISFYAKKARGAMARYLIENKANSVNDLLEFSNDGYSYSESESQKSNSPVFIR